MTSTDESRMEDISDEDIFSSLQVLQEEYNQNPFVKTEGNDENKFPKEGVQALFCLYLTLACDPCDPDPKNLPHVGMDDNCAFFYKASSGKKRRDANFIEYMKVVLYKELPSDTFRYDLQKQKLSYKNYVMQLTERIRDFLSDNKRLPIVFRVIKNHFGNDFKLTWIKDDATAQAAKMIPEEVPAQAEAGPAQKGGRQKMKATARGTHVEAEGSEAAPAGSDTTADDGGKKVFADHLLPTLLKKQQEKLKSFIAYEHKCSKKLGETALCLSAYTQQQTVYYKRTWHRHGATIMEWTAKNPFLIVNGQKQYATQANATPTAEVAAPPPAAAAPVQGKEDVQDGSKGESGSENVSEDDSDQGQDDASEDQGGAAEEEPDDGDDQSSHVDSECPTPKSASDLESDPDSDWQDVRRPRKAAAKAKRRRVLPDNDSDDDRPLKQTRRKAPAKQRKQLASKSEKSSPQPAPSDAESDTVEADPPKAAQEPTEPDADADAGGLFASPPQEERLEDLVKKANEGTLANHCETFKNLFLHGQTKIRKAPSKVEKGVEKTTADTATRSLICKIQESRAKFADAEFAFLDQTFNTEWNGEPLHTTLYDYQRSAVKEALGIVQDVGSVIISGEPSWGKTVASAALVLLLQVKHCVIFCTNATMDQWHKDVSRFNTLGRLRVQKLDAGKDPSDLRLDMADAEAHAEKNVATFWLAHHGVLGDSKRSNKVIFLLKEKDCAFVFDEPQEYLRNATSSSCNAHALLRNGLRFRRSRHYAILATATPTVKIEEAQHYLSRVLYLPALPISLLNNTVEAKRNCGKVLSMLRVPDPMAEGCAGLKYPPCAVYDFILEKPPPLKQRKQAEVARALELTAQGGEEESEEPRGGSKKARGLEMSAQAAAYRTGCGYHCTEFPPALMALVAALSLLQRGLTGVIFTENKQLIRDMQAEVNAMEPEHDDLKARVFYVDGDSDVERRAGEMNKFVATAKTGGALCITTLGCNKSGTNKFQQADARFMFLAGEICPDAETLHQAMCRIMRQQQENAVMVVKFACTDEYSQSMGVLSARKQVENASATWRKFKFHALYKEGRGLLAGKGTATKGKLQPVMEAEYLVSCILALYELLKQRKMVLHCENVPFLLNPNSPVKPVNRLEKNGGDLDESDKAQVKRYIDDAKACLRLVYKHGGQLAEVVQAENGEAPQSEDVPGSKAAPNSEAAPGSEAAPSSEAAPQQATDEAHAGEQPAREDTWWTEVEQAVQLAAK